MARIITKELALKIIKKLGATDVTARNSPHDLYEVVHRGVVVAHISIRRGSDRDQGHDHLKDDLHIGPHKARLLGQCPLSREEYIRILQEKGLAPADEEQQAQEHEREGENA